MSFRVYVPTSLDALARYAEEGGIGPSPVHGHAVTQWLRDSWPEADEEEWAYAALMAAADQSAAGLTGGQRPRRVVLVAEVERVTADRESTAVTVDSAIALRLLQAVHADTADIDPASEDAGDLAWFGVQEIPDLLA
ncbi:MAG: hypothetical protein JWQ67_273 [Marmoricola sp.]|nr:hypothetical protein [Marmoricola sp.]